MTSSTETAMTDDTRRTARSLSTQECENLRIVAGMMIPPSRRYNVPGADDPLIFGDIVASIERDEDALRRALRHLDQLADGRLPELDGEARTRVLRAFRERFTELTGIMEATIARCYYRDDRVMASIGMEVRPPFPLGYEVDEGDWSLLDPVRARGKMYRDAQ